MKLDLNVELNKNLINKQQLSKSDVENIKKLHAQRICIEKCMELEDNSEKLKLLFFLWNEIQNELQKAWKFEQDYRYIRFWEVPKCECPKSDNEESYGYGRFVYNMSCPVHGTI